MALKRVGVLWKKTDKKNREYFSGNIDMGVMGEVPIMIFENEKAEEKHPDYTIHLVTEEESE